MNAVEIVGRIQEVNGEHIIIHSEKNVFDCINKSETKELENVKFVKVKGYFKSEDKNTKKKCSECKKEQTISITENYIVLKEIIPLEEEEKERNCIKIKGLVKTPVKTFTVNTGKKINQIRIKCHNYYSYISINTEKDISEHKIDEEIYCKGKLSTKYYDKKYKCRKCDTVHSIGERNSIIINPYMIEKVSEKGD